MNKSLQFAAALEDRILPVRGEGRAAPGDIDTYINQDVPERQTPGDVLIPFGDEDRMTICRAGVLLMQDERHDIDGYISTYTKDQQHWHEIAVAAVDWAKAHGWRPERT